MPVSAPRTIYGSIDTCCRPRSVGPPCGGGSGSHWAPPIPPPVSPPDDVVVVLVVGPVVVVVLLPPVCVPPLVPIVSVAPTPSGGSVSSKHPVASKAATANRPRRWEWLRWGSA